jgi:PAS domain S-box-containing protein
VGIFRTSHAGRLLEANPAFAQIFGYASVAELAEVSEGSVARLYTSPLDRKLLLEALDSCPEGATLEVELRRRDGSVFLGAIIASLEFDAAMRPAFINGIIEDITERKRTVKALAESEARFRDLFETMPNGFYRSTPAGYFVDANPAFVHMLGYDSLDELRTVHIPTAIYVHETERQEILTDNPEFVSQIENYRLRRKDGKVIRIEDNARYIKDGSGNTVFHEGICRDVTDRWEAVARLRQSEEKFARLFRLSPDVVMLVRLADGLVLDVNEAFSTTTGYETPEAVGRTIPELGLAGDRYARRTLLEVLGQSGRAENLEFPLRRKDGSVIDCVLSCQVLSVDGQECVLAVLRDVTEFKRMQEMMVQTEKMVSVGGIAAGVAHEINNPLGIIMNTAQNLAMRTRPDFPKNVQVARELGLNMDLLDRYMQARGLHDFIQTIQDAAMRAANIIRHMLDFSRRSESRCTACDLPAIVDKAVNLARSDYDLSREYDFKQISVVRDYDEQLPEVRCTETEIEQVILNLLRNAAQAMSGIRHDLSDPRITVRIRNDRSHLRIEVEDNGPGMPPEVQRRVFEPFFTTKPPGVGTGLGLSVSYFIVTRSHKGRMRVESAPGEGTRFIVELPVTRSASELPGGACPSE